MKVVKILAVLVVGVVLLVVGGALLLPRFTHVERSTVILAPQATVFTLVNGHRGFERWSPWYERDPDALWEVSGPVFGEGATLRWESDIVGSGIQTIVASHPFERVEAALDFGPRGTATAAFGLQGTDIGTTLTWTLDTDAGWSPFDRWMGLLLDRWVGGDYEAGLANLKALAESLPPADWSDLDIVVVEVEAVPILAVRTHAGASEAAVGRALDGAFGTIARFIDRNGLEMVGAPLALVRSWGEEGYELDAGVPVTGTLDLKALERAGIALSETPAGRVVRAAHVGRHRDMPVTYAKIAAFMAAHGFEPGEVPWESFVSDPAEVGPDELVTVISYPVQDPPSAQRGR